MLIVAADYREHVADVQAKLRSGAGALSVDVLNLAHTTCMPGVEIKARYDAVLLWTASWARNGGATAYDQRATGDRLAAYVDLGGRVLQLYTNPAPSGRWESGEYAPAMDGGVYLIKTLAPTLLQLEADGSHFRGHMASPLWVNKLAVSRRVGATTAVVARFPGPGRQDGEPLLAVRTRGAGTGAVWQLNVYPPSQDAGTAPASSLWSKPRADLSLLMKWALKVAAGHAATTEGCTTSPAPMQPSAIRDAIRDAIRRGVPEWNAGRQDRCTQIYLAFCCRLATEDTRLRDAALVAATETASTGGWTLRKAMDAVCQDIDSGVALQRTSSVPPSNSGAEGGRAPETASSSGARGSGSDHADVASMSISVLFRELKAALVGHQWAHPRTAALTRVFVKALGGEDLEGTISAAIAAGVPVWNSGDYAGCATIYRAVAQHYSEEAEQLADALFACDETDAPLTSAGDSQGWILRHALDDVLENGAEAFNERDLLTSRARNATVRSSVTVSSDASRVPSLGSSNLIPDESRGSSSSGEDGLSGCDDADEEAYGDYDVDVDYTAIPGRMVCPITQRVMQDPVICQ